MSDAGFTPDQIDTNTPHPARMYDYYLGGMDNYEVDRRAADELVNHSPDVRITARANRDFHHRAIRHLVESGVRQIIDIGTGIPTSPNTHEVAREADPDVTVIYVDNDPIVATYAGAKLTNSGNAGFVLADVRDPQAILRDSAVTELIDFSQPVAVLLVAVLHFVQDDEDPHGLISALTENLVPGSPLVLTHGTHDVIGEEGLRYATDAYKKSTANLRLRNHAEISSFFEGFELVEPGVVQLPLWRPEGTPATEEDLKRVHGYGGVGIKR
ncbi:SAM-dependent methyltransferase [Streptomyces sp. NPDC005438]|uniref:SAM-dependent methyltransferase n=1 Tax=Streptomyces sp. NPDC005438 TaxID=3156880 RepID=UPI0033B00927